MSKKFFKSKSILITGGTGSIGSNILQGLTNYNPKKIIIYSRDEYKQYKLKHKYRKLNFIDYLIGDVRDLESLESACKSVDIIYHCAALKHVPVSEERPEEFIKTNILGTLNVKKASIQNKVPITILISSDKAVDSSSLMGMTKAIQEKIFSANPSQELVRLKFISIRLGNIIGTTGSIFPIIYHQIINNQPILITHPDMTRFYMTQKEATKLIFWATLNGKNSEIVTQRMKSIKLRVLIEKFLNITKAGKNYKIQNIGVRVGEKMHECLLSESELTRIKKNGPYYTINPYSKISLIRNTIQNSIKPKNFDGIYFSSNFQPNIMSETNVTTRIKDFIKEVSNNTQII